MSLLEEGIIKHKYDKSSDFCSNHVYLQPPDPWEDEKTSLAYEGCKMKDNCEGDEFTPSFFVGDHKIIANDNNVVNGVNTYFGSDPKEEHISDLKSLYELPNEVEDKPPLARCELGKSKKKNLMQRDEHSSYCWTLLQHDGAEISRHEMLFYFCTDHMSFQHSKIPSPPHHGSVFLENSKVELYVENEFCVVGPSHMKIGIICQLLEE